MAQRQKIEEAERVKDAFVAQILLDLAFNRLQIREDVAMRDDHTLRFAGGTRREDDLHRIVAR